MRPVLKCRESVRLAVRRAVRGGRRRRGTGRRRRVVAEEVLRKTLQFELFADCPQLVAVHAVEPVCVPVRLDRNVRPDRRQELRYRRVLPAGEHLLRELALELRNVREYPLYRPELRKEIGRRLLADSADARDVVRRVSRECEVVDHLRRLREMPVLAHLRLVVYLCGVARMRGTVQPHSRTDELGGILVGRRHVDVEAGGRPLHRERSHHVVRLESVDAHDRNPERLRELERVRNRRREILRHLLALRLVRCVRPVAERGSARIHRENGVRGLLALQYGLESGREAEERRGVDAGRRHARIPEEHEVSLVEERHEVDYEKLVHGDIISNNHFSECESTSHPVSVTTTRSSMRTPRLPTR